MDEGLNPFNGDEEAALDAKFEQEFRRVDFEVSLREKLHQAFGSLEPPEGAKERLQQRLRDAGFDV